MEPLAGLSPGGRPAFHSGEVELKLLELVDWEDPPGPQPRKAGIAWVTSHRLLWVDPAATGDESCGSVALPLEHVASASKFYKRSGTLLGVMLPAQTPRLRVVLTRPPGEVTLACRGAPPDAFLSQLLSAVAARAWSRPLLPSGPPVPPALPPLPTPPPPPSPPSPWVCPQCTLDNVAAATTCGLCGAHRPSAMGAWDCPDCTLRNVRGDASCVACGQRAPLEEVTWEQRRMVGRGDAGDGPGPMPPPPAGVTSVLRGEASRAAVAAGAVDVGLRDLSSLMDSAREMACLAAALRASLASTGSQAGIESGSQSGSQSLTLAESELADWLLAAGVTSPVTKSAAGAQYHAQLARQLADFCLGVGGHPGALTRGGGCLPLPDLYCLYNRARAAELVSPADVRAACGLWSSLGLPLSLRQFDSGLLVAQDASRGDGAACATLAKLAAGETARARGMGAPEAAAALGVPLLLAREMLGVAEARGVLCRDDGPDGLRFYRNVFVSGEPAG